MFRAISDPTRRGLLDRLRKGKRPVADLASEFPVSRPAISKHLRILKQARLVRERRDGRQRVYELSPGPLEDVDAWLGEYRRFLRESLERLKGHVEDQLRRESSE